MAYEDSLKEVAEEKNIPFNKALEIVAVADKLKESGKTTRNFDVRQAMGGGSLEYISPIMRFWREQQKEEHQLAEVRVPDAINEKFTQLQGALWNAAIGEAERRLNSERDALKEARENMETELKEADYGIALLESEIENIKAKSAESESKLAETQIELSEYKDRLMNLRDETSQTLSDRTAKIESLTATVAELRKSLEKSEKRSELLEAKTEQQQKEHQDKIDEIRKDHQNEIKTIWSEHRDALAAETKKVEQLESQNKHLSATSEQSQARLELAQSEIEQHRTATAKMREKLESAQQEAAELRGELKALRTEKKLEKDKGNG